MRTRLQETGPAALYRKRQEIIERRFGQLKQHDGFRRWTVRGLEAVQAQWALLCATLNLRILHKKWQARMKTPPVGVPTATAHGIWAMAA